MPLGGFTQGGYKLVYNDTPPSWEKNGGGHSRYGTSFATSIGFSVEKDGTITNVQWDSAAFKAGLTPGMQIVGVNGLAPDPDDGATELVKNAIVQAEKDTAPIHFVVKKAGAVSDVAVDYHGGLRYPHLERIEGTPDRLDAILAPVQ